MEMDWMKTAVDSLKEQLTFAKELLGSEGAAIQYVQVRSTAGRDAWNRALSELNFKVQLIG